jgi:fatty acid synthase
MSLIYLNLLKSVFTQMLLQPLRFAAHLFKVKDPATGKPLNQGQLRAELGIMLGAGFETTSNAIAWTMGALATHPAVQSKLVSELSAAGLVGLGARQFEWGDVSRLPYLNAVIKESLRLFAPTPLGTTRVAQHNLKLMGHGIPKVR